MLTHQNHLTPYHDPSSSQTPPMSLKESKIGPNLPLPRTGILVPETEGNVYSLSQIQLLDYYLQCLNACETLETQLLFSEDNLNFRQKRLLFQLVTAALFSKSSSPISNPSLNRTSTSPRPSTMDENQVSDESATQTNEETPAIWNEFSRQAFRRAQLAAFYQVFFGKSTPSFSYLIENMTPRKSYHIDKTIFNRKEPSPALSKLLKISIQFLQDSPAFQIQKFILPSSVILPPIRNPIDGAFQKLNQPFKVSFISRQNVSSTPNDDIKPLSLAKSDILKTILVDPLTTMEQISMYLDFVHTFPDQLRENAKNNSIHGLDGGPNSIPASFSRIPKLHDAPTIGQMAQANAMLIAADPTIDESGTNGLTSAQLEIDRQNDEMLRRAIAESLGQAPPPSAASAVPVPAVSAASAPPTPSIDPFTSPDHPTSSEEDQNLTPLSPKFVLFMNGVAVGKNQTLLSTIYDFAQNPPPSGSKLSTVGPPFCSSRTGLVSSTPWSFWDFSYSFTFSPGPDYLKEETPVFSTSIISNNSNLDPDLASECLDDHFGETSIPSRVVTVVEIVKILWELNTKSNQFFFTDALLQAFVDSSVGKAEDASKIPIRLPSLSDSIIPTSKFSLNEIASKISEQLHDPFALTLDRIPDWIPFLLKNLSFCFDFDTRKLYFDTCIVGPHRGLEYVQDAVYGRHSTEKKKMTNGFRTNHQLPRQSITINRKTILNDAIENSNTWFGSKCKVNIIYENEVGVGLGPTVEYFTSVMEQFQKASTRLWLNQEQKNSAGCFVPNAEPSSTTTATTATTTTSTSITNSSQLANTTTITTTTTTTTADESPIDQVDDSTPLKSSSTQPSQSSDPSSKSKNQPQQQTNTFVNIDNGLFPISSNRHSFDKKVQTLGALCGQALLDGRILNLPFASSAYKIILGQSCNIFDILIIDPEIGLRYLEFYLLVLKMRGLRAASYSEDLDFAEPEQIKYKNCDLQDLDLSFVLFGRSDIPLCANGNNIALTNSNLEEFLNCATNALFTQPFFSTFKSSLISTMNKFSPCVVGDNPTVLPTPSTTSSTSQLSSSSSLPAPKITHETAIFSTAISPAKSIDFLFTPNELDQLFNGTSLDPAHWNKTELEKWTQPGTGFTKTSPTITWLIQILTQDFGPDEQKVFLAFLTGSPRLPLGGLKNLPKPFTVVRKRTGSVSGYDTGLPSVMTCTTYLKVGKYASKAELLEKLRTAMNYSSGFHLA